MTSRTAVTATRRTASALCLLLAALLAPLSAAPTASACDVSYRYAPSIKFDGSGFGVTPCSNATSLAGTSLLALVTAAALIAIGAALFRKGEATARTLGDETGPARVLEDYLRAPHATGDAPTAGRGHAPQAQEGRVPHPQDGHDPRAEGDRDADPLA
ncbi:hypothetical protein ACFYYR_25135 [Streptomyces sp. NPDC001922]|uniref:hypothetical protein n=1 Tax=Streptomyces sp. NPDC001922 TaxID=3364624 RepID=UPI00369F08F5